LEKFLCELVDSKKADEEVGKKRKKELVKKKVKEVLVGEKKIT
jgi:hypothetical protein